CGRSLRTMPPASLRNSARISMAWCGPQGPSPHATPKPSRLPPPRSPSPPGAVHRGAHLPPLHPAEVAPFEFGKVSRHFAAFTRPLRVTPAMESNLTDHVWELAELLA